MVLNSPPNIWNVPKGKIRMSANTYRNRGFTPNDSKKRVQPLTYPRLSMHHINNANRVDANPQVVRAKVGVQIFLLSGHP